MTDNSSIIAGNFPGANNTRITCILQEGAPTVGTSYDQNGRSMTTMTWQAELAEGDYVALANDTECTFAATEGTPVVEKAGDSETLVIGKIISTPKLNRMPANTAAGDSLTKRLVGGYYRVANVQILGGIQMVAKAEIMCDGSHACVPGVGSTLKFNITSSYVKHKLCFDSVASGGVGVIPFHYVPAGSDGDLYSCLVGITGLLIAATGA
jgi:hypothetical protein